jgi:DNA-binding NtrC family response regulator
MQDLSVRPVAKRRSAIPWLLNRMFEEQNSPLRVEQLTVENQGALASYDWPHNFLSLREAATWLTAIDRVGSVLHAAEALELPTSTLNHWYRNTLGLSRPLSFRQKVRDLNN